MKHKKRKAFRNLNVCLRSQKISSALFKNIKNIIIIVYEKSMPPQMSMAEAV